MKKEELEKSVIVHSISAGLVNIMCVGELVTDRLPERLHCTSPEATL